MASWLPFPGLGPDREACAGCSRAFAQRDERFEAQGKTYHAACFRCGGCRKPIAGQYYADDGPGGGTLRCAACQAARAPRCQACAQPLVDKYVEALGGRYHQECVACTGCRQRITGTFYPTEDEKGLLCARCHEAGAPRCAACRRAITGRYTTAGSEAYHPECFVCATCRRQLSGNYFEGAAGLLCAGCHDAANPPPRCGGCGKPIHGRSLSSDSQTYHPECFCCCRCRTALDGPFWWDEARTGRLCAACQPRCGACRSPLEGQPSVRVGGEDLHLACFRCGRCGQCLDGPYFEPPEAAAASGKRCLSCHRQHLQEQEDREAAHHVAKEQRLHRRNTDEFRLVWREELAPSSRQALLDLGVRDLPLGREGQVCVCYDRASRRVACAPVSASSHPEAVVSLPYLACVLRVLRDSGHEPVFSLDPKDPHDLAGPLLVKRFHPPWLAGTVVGEVLFQADYALKRLCFGDDLGLPGLPNAFDAPADGEERAVRQWFTVRRASLTTTSDGALVPHVELGVEARRLSKSAGGYADAQFTDPRDPMVQQAAAVSARFAELAQKLPVAGELLALARATVVAVYLLSQGCRCNDSVLDRYKLAKVPEGRAYPVEIPTLTKERRAAQVTEGAAPEEVLVLRQARLMRGGVDLSVPRNEGKPSLPARAVAARLLDARVVPASLPLFLSPTAARAA